MAKHDLSIHYFQRKISDFCEVRIAPIASKRVLDSIRPYLIGLIIRRQAPPIVNGRMDWTAIGQACGIEDELTAELKKQLRPGLDAIIRWFGAPLAAEDMPSRTHRTSFSSITVVSCRRIKRHLRRKYSIRFGKRHSLSDLSLIHIVQADAETVSTSAWTILVVFALSGCGL